MRIFIFLSSCISTLWFNMQRYVSINVFSLGLSCVTITWRIFYPRKTDCSLVLQVSSDMLVSMWMILLLLETWKWIMIQSNFSCSFWKWGTNKKKILIFLIMSQLHVMILDPGMKSTALLLNFVYNQVQETWQQLIRNKFLVGFSIIALY